MENQNYDFPVFATQRGGLVREVGHKKVFVEIPPSSDFKVGDLMPEEWITLPANEKFSAFSLELGRFAHWLG